jgi:hypothetical protein
MFRGHVPTIQASKAHAIVNFAGKNRGRFAGMFTRKVGLFVHASVLPQMLPTDPARER